MLRRLRVGAGLLAGPAAQVLHDAGGGALDVPLLNGCLCLPSYTGRGRGGRVLFGSETALVADLGGAGGGASWK